MSVLSRFAGGLRALLRRRKADQELDDELRAYLDAAAEHHRGSGMGSDAARRAARISLGSVEAVKDHTRDVGWESIVGALRQDLRYGLRTLGKAPTFTVVAVGTLAVGIGATTAIFTLVNALLLAPLPFKDPNRLMLVHLTAPAGDDAPGIVRKVVWSYPKYRRFRDTQQNFEPPTLFDGREWTLTGTAEPEALTSTRFLEPLLYRVSRNNPAMFALDAAILLGVSALAACIPARRASRVDPLTSLREE